MSSNKKPGLGVRLAYLHFTLSHAKDQGQVHAVLICEYVVNGSDRTNVAIAIAYKVMYGLSTGILHMTMTHYRGQVTVMNSAIENISSMVTDRAHIKLSSLLYKVVFGLLIDIFTFDFGR